MTVNVQSLRGMGLVLLVLAGSPAMALAQWLEYPTPGIPRKADGTPDLKAPVPRTSDGKPDFSGMWFANVPSRDGCRTGDCIQEERMAREHGGGKPLFTGVTKIYEPEPEAEAPK